jgi:hypothetical protein
VILGLLTIRAFLVTNHQKCVDFMLVDEAVAEPCHREWRPFDDEEFEQPKGSLATNLGGGLSSG